MRQLLRVYLLGPVEVERGGVVVRGFESRKALALLCYLASTEQPHTRSHLAHLFWGDKPESRGRGNLSRVLHNLSNILPEHLQVDRYNVQLHRDAALWLDVDVFEELIARKKTESLVAAAERFRGDFMADFFLPDCRDFEAWLAMERDRWRERAVKLLSLLITYSSDGDYEKSLRFANRLLSVAPWREGVHRLKMHVLARTGQRGAALSQYASCRRILAEELGVEPSEETTALYDRIRSSEGPRQNLPVQPTPLIGREEEVAAVRRFLMDTACRLLTLLGPGGVGKTRVALQAAAEMGEIFPDGIFLVPSAPIRSGAFLFSAIANTIGVDCGGSANPKARLFNHLRNKATLLVLDNFEHLAEEGPLLAEFMANTAKLKLLVTSRERLKLRAEWVFKILGLGYPKQGDERPETLEESAAVKLFVQSARRSRMDFAMSEEPDRRALAHICRLLGGIPLGIELAAARVREFRCCDIDREIELNLDFLSTTMRDIPERHRSMRAVFDQSWSRLTEAERVVFRKLSVFRGGFRQEAAIRVAGASAYLLSSLADKSFLSTTPEGRYEIHEVLRQFGNEKLKDELEEEEATYASHCRYYAALLQKREFSAREERGSLREAEKEIDNLRAAWRWAVESGETREIGKMVEGLSTFCELRGCYREGAEAFGIAAERFGESLERFTKRKTRARWSWLRLS